MVYRKFIRRNGKTYGPYHYHSRRVGGKVVSHYAGRSSAKFDSYRILYGLLIFAFVAAVLFLLYDNNLVSFSPGQKVTLDEVKYNPGERLGGEVLFVVDDGVIPPESNVVFTLGEEEPLFSEKTFPLLDVVEFEGFDPSDSEVIRTEDSRIFVPVEREFSAEPSAEIETIYPTLKFDLVLKTKEYVLEETEENILEDFLEEWIEDYFPFGNECGDDSDCDSVLGEFCLRGNCVLPCVGSEDCLDEDVCLNGLCVSEFGCQKDEDCASGEYCFYGECVPEEGGEGGGEAQPTCFVEGTEVLMFGGSKSIEEVVVGDLVLSFDFDSGELEYSEVSETFEHLSEGYLIINGVMRLTENHPIYLGGVWKQAGDAKVGDILKTVDGFEIIHSIESVSSTETVYNLEVEGNHNYFADGFLVHNKVRFPYETGFSTAAPDFSGLYDSGGSESDSESISADEPSVPDVSSSEDSGSNSDSPDVTKLSGAVIRDFVEREVSSVEGRTKFERDFVLEFDPGTSVELVEGSVVNSLTGDVLPDDSVDLDFADGIVVVSTDYSMEGYFQKSTYKVDIGRANLVSFNEDSELTVSLVDPNGAELGVVKGNVNVLTKADGYYMTTSVRGRDATYGAVLGEPVEWVKEVEGVDRLKEVVFEIPRSAEIVSVVGVDEEGFVVPSRVDDSSGSIVLDPTLESESEEPLKESDSEGIDSDAKGISPIEESPDEGLAEMEEDVSARYEEDSSFEGVDRIENSFDGVAVTGNFLFLGTEGVLIKNDVGVDRIEMTYKTPAPQVLEKSRIGSSYSVTFGSPDDVHYKDVFVYTDIDPALGVRSLGDVSVYHVVDGAREKVSIEEVGLTPRGIVDYVAWVVPHMSNQTYEIIVDVSEAEHLDSERVFLSDVSEAVVDFDGAWCEPIYSDEYLRIKFAESLDRNDEISVYARSSGTSGLKVYLENSDVELADFGEIGESRLYSVLLDEMGFGQTSDSFDLRVSGDAVEVDYVLKPGAEQPAIWFGDRTPLDGTVLSSSNIEVDLETASNEDVYTLLNFDGDVLLWYRMDDFNSSTVWDVSGNMFDGSVLDAGFVEGGVWGNALSLDSNGSVVVEDGGLLRPSDLFSLSSWVSLGDGSSGSLFSFGNGSDFEGFGLDYVSSEGFGFDVLGDSSVSVSSGSVESGWHHIVLVKDSSELRIYVDGVLEGTSDFEGELNYSLFDGVWRIGGSFEGLIDEFVLFDRALDSAEILALNDAGAHEYSRSFVGVDPGIVSFRGFVVDSSGGVNWTEERQVLINSLPNVSLVSPVSGDVLSEVMPTFEWVGSDYDGDFLSYELNVSAVSSETCSEPNRIIRGIDLESYAFEEPLAPLGCFDESNDSYVWSVRAFDGYAYGSWSDLGEFSVSQPVLPSPVVESIDFWASDSIVGEEATLFLRVGGSVGEGSTPISSIIEVYDPTGELVERVDLGSDSVPSSEFVEYNIKLDTEGYVVGDYRAVAKVKFDDREKSKEAEFRLGSLFVGVSDYTRVLEKDSINEISVDVKSYWGEIIPEVYAVIDVGGREIQTPSVALYPWEELTLKRNFDTTGIDMESVDVQITVFYNGDSNTENVEMYFDRGVDLPLVGLAIVVFLALIFVVIYVARYFSSRSKK